MRVSLRALFLLGFVIAMPVLALPPVARQMDEWIHGATPDDFARPLGSSVPTPEVMQAANDQVVPAGFDEVAASSSKSALRGLDAPPPSPPPLAAIPAFESSSPMPATPVEAIDEATIARLQAVRQRLEELGAEYILVEMTEDETRYRFYCRMLVDPRTRFTRPFEAISPDPLAAAEKVLGAVETWRRPGVAAGSAPE